METMTKGRVYAVVGGNEVKQIVYMDNSNKRIKTIDIDHTHKGIKPHVHRGYLHNENDGRKGASKLMPDEKKMIERVTSIWDNHSDR